MNDKWLAQDEDYNAKCLAQPGIYYCHSFWIAIEGVQSHFCINLVHFSITEN